MNLFLLYKTQQCEPGFSSLQEAIFEKIDAKLSFPR